MTVKKHVNNFVRFAVGCVVCIALLAIYNRAMAQRGVMMCETDRTGKVCCWDTSQYGPNKPFICQ